MSILSISIQYRYDIVKICFDIATISTISSQCAGIDIDEALLIFRSAVLLSISSISIRYRQNICRYRNVIDDIYDFVTVCWYRNRQHLVDIVTISTISYLWSLFDMYGNMHPLGPNVLNHGGQIVRKLPVNLYDRFWNMKRYFYLDVYIILNRI